MNNRAINRQRMWMLFVVALFVGGLAAMVGGCSTISGTAGLMRGIAQDVEDLAEGARERMAE